MIFHHHQLTYHHDFLFLLDLQIFGEVQFFEIVGNAKVKVYNVQNSCLHVNNVAGSDVFAC